MSEKPSDIIELRDNSLAVIPSEPATVLPPASKDPATSFLAACQNARTQQTMRECLERIETALGAAAGSIPWPLMRLSHTEDIRARLSRRYSPATVNLTLAALRGVLRSAWKLDLISGDDYTKAISVENLKVDRTPAGRAIPAKEWVEIEAYARSLGPESRDWPESAYGAFLLALFSLLYGAGLRASEAAGLTLKGYDAQARTLQFLGKGRKMRVAPLGNAENAALETWIGVRAELELGQDAPLLVNVHPNGRVARIPMLNRQKIERICKAVAQRAGVERFSPHDLRRTFATAGLDAGMDLATMQRFLGHSDPKTTVRYDRRPLERDGAARRTFDLIGRDIDAVAQRARVLAALAKKR